MTPRPRTLYLAPFLLFAIISCGRGRPTDLANLAIAEGSLRAHDLVLQQELVNDAPIGPGVPQPSEHCPQSPGHWFSGSGRSTATSNVFGNLTEVEVYCINVEREELSGGLATWTDVDGDTITMSFGAKLLKGSMYSPAPSAPMVGHAHFTGGTGKWASVTGAAHFTGRQNGDGTASLSYRGTIYLVRQDR